MKKKAEDSKITANGLFHFSLSYNRSGILIFLDKENYPFKNVPAIYMFCHSMELYLKSYLMTFGVSVSDLQEKYGHNLLRLFDKATSVGLVCDVPKSFIEAINSQRFDLNLRYLREGEYRIPPLGEFMLACERIRINVHKRLASVGYEVHSLDTYNMGHRKHVADKLRLFVKNHNEEWNADSADE